jgi:hypothetical protein
MRYYLTVELLSDATFGRGEGVAGLVDVEVDHDAAGCPQIGGRALKGLLVEEWANLRAALARDGQALTPWDAIADTLFGSSGAGDAGGGRLHVGAATLPDDLRAALAADKGITPSQVLAALTTIRRQTSVDAVTGAPEDGSLRAVRAVVRGVMLVAPLDLHLPDAEGLEKGISGEGQALPEPLPTPQERAEALLAACALAVRRGGLSRNRGRGRLALRLHRGVPADQADDSFDSFTRACFARFAAEVHA